MITHEMVLLLKSMLLDKDYLVDSVTLDSDDDELMVKLQNGQVFNIDVRRIK